MKKKIEIVIVYLLLTTILVFPLSLNIALLSPKDLAHPIIAINFSFADILIGIALILWIYKIIFYKELKQIKIPPKPVFVLIGVGFLSLINAFSIIEWLKEFIKFIEYFILLYVLLLNNLENVKMSKIVNMLFVITSIILLIAIIQHTLLQGSSYLVRGLFDNRNSLGSYLCITIPLIYSDFLNSNNLYRKIWLGLLMISSVLVLLSGSALLSLIISLSIVSFLYSKSIFFKYLISIVLFIVMYFFLMPQKNIDAIKEFASIYEKGKISENYYRRITILNDLKKDTIYRKNIGKNTLIVTNDLFMPSVLPSIRSGERYIDMDGQKHIKNRYLEMQAALNMMAANALSGIGLGNFQNFIGTYYKDLPKVNTAEPNQSNGYLIIGSTIGLLGLATLIWIFIYCMTNVYKRFKMHHDANDKIISLGILGALIACSIENFFSYIFLTCLLVPLVFIFYISKSEFSNK